MPNHPPALYFTALASNLDGNKEEARRGLMQLFRNASSDNQYVLQGKDLLNKLDANIEEAGSAKAAAYAVLPVGGGT